VGLTKDTPIETVPGADPKETIDDAVVKIAKKKRSGSAGFDDLGGVRGRTSNDGDQEERAEV
jgi:hypothetical protein